MYLKDAVLFHCFALYQIAKLGATTEAGSERVPVTTFLNKIQLVQLFIFLLRPLPYPALNKL